MKATHNLNTSGMGCPMPILELKKTVKNMRPGDTVRLIATDPGSLNDVESFCRQTSNTLLERGQSEGRYEFLIRKEAP